MNVKNFAGLAIFAVVSANAQAPSIHAQKVVDAVKSVHPEIEGIEIAASKTGGACQTIAATEAKEVGQKCDKDELTAIKTNKPFVEKEKTEWDVTLPLHDSAGKIIATAGMDLKLSPSRNKETVVAEAQKIAAELEKSFPSKDDLFKPVN